MDKSKIRKQIRESITGYSDYIKGGKTKGLSHDELVTILTNAAKGIKPNKPKEQIKEEENPEIPAVQPGSQDPVDAVTMDIPLFLLLMEYAKEHAKEDVDLHQLAEKANKLGKERGILSSEDYNELVDETPSEDENEEEPISENFQYRLKESVKNALFRKPLKEDKKGKKEDKGGEELESSVSIEDTPPAEPAPQAQQQAPAKGEEEAPAAEPQENPNTTIANNDGKVNPHAKSVQDALTQAQVAAQSLGDQKLMDQIGNTITFFTRAHIVGTGQ